MLDVKNLSVNYDRSILTDLSFTVSPGEIVAVVGPSGCGTSTLMRAIAGLVDISGRVSVDGKDISRTSIEDRPVALVSQTPALFESMTVREKVAFGLDDPVMTPTRRDDLVDIALASLNILHCASDRPSVLSGGERGRVALARALVRRPRVLLLDEPLAHVDDALRAPIRRDIMALAARLRIAVLFVTHDIDEACMISDRIMVIVEGQIRQCARPTEVYLQCADLDVARIMGHTNVHAVTVTQVGSYATVQCGSRLMRCPAHPEVRVGPAALVVPSGHVTLRPSSMRDVYGSTGHVVSATRARFYTNVEVETEIGTVTAITNEVVAPGDMVEVHFDRTWVLPRNADAQPPAV